MSAAKKGVTPKVSAEQAQLQQQATAILSRDELEKLKKGASSHDDALGLDLDLDFDVMGSDNLENLPDMSVLSDVEEGAKVGATKVADTKSSKLSLDALEDIEGNADSTSDSALSAVKLNDLPGLDLEMESISSSNSESLFSADGSASADDDKFSLDLDGLLDSESDFSIEGTKTDTEAGEDLVSGLSSSEIQVDELDDLAFDAGPAPDISPSQVPSPPIKIEQDEYLTSSAELDFSSEDENLAPTRLIDRESLSTQRPDPSPSSLAQEQDIKEMAKSVAYSSNFEDFADRQDYEFNSKEGTKTKLQNQMRAEASPKMASQMTQQFATRGESLFPLTGSSVSGLNSELGSLIAQAKDDASFKAYYEEEMLKLKSLVQGLREDRARMIKEMEEIKERNLKLEQSNLNHRADYEDKIIEIEVIKKRYQKDLEDMRLTLELNLQKKEMAEARLRHRQANLDAMAKKLKIDFKKVQEREKHLEGQLELLRADSASQILSRDNKILELKRKIDTMEFDLEAMSEEEKKMKQDNVYVQEKMDSAMGAIRKALQMLEDSPDVGNDPISIENQFFRRPSKGK